MDMRIQTRDDPTHEDLEQGIWSEEINIGKEQKWETTDGLTSEPLFFGVSTSSDFPDNSSAPPKSSAFRHHFWSLTFSISLIFLLLIGVIWVRVHAVFSPEPETGDAVPVQNSSSNALTVNGMRDGQATIVVDIHGDVHQPGVYRLPANARVQDAVQAAGGYRHGEDATYVNAAALLDDGVEVVIPGPLEEGRTQPAGNQVESIIKSGPGTNPENQANSLQIDLNTADERTLQTLPGIGPGRAAAIAGYRRERGPFQRVQDLLNVPGIGDKTLAHLISYVFVSTPAHTS